MFSLVYLLQTNEFDWQLRTDIFRGDSVTIAGRQPMSPNWQCMKISNGEFVRLLRESHNILAEAPLERERCLFPTANQSIDHE
jgi:hypothetical protein